VGGERAPPLSCLREGLDERDRETESARARERESESERRGVA
jgi:hypothetical protein